jgi:aspartyl-tRNA(Asn)/glutamyl-tRNA(Gln) amidotransferase subunit A
VTIAEAARRLRAREVSASELLEQCLGRIATMNPALNAFITVTEESARETARQADRELARGLDRGPLQGIPVAVKDVFLTRGVRTTAGSRLFADYVPDHDAATVERLAQAGAVLVGKTNMHELAYGITSANPHFGVVRNPRDPARIPGGSSGGSAVAVASGMALAALGSDTGGSIRIPAAFCGVVGLKPTYGRVSRHGMLPLSFSMDHAGPIASSVSDAGLVLNAIAGHDPRDPASSSQPVEDYLPAGEGSLEGVRIGLPENFYFERVTPQVREAVERAATLAAQHGASVVQVRVPDMDAVNMIGRVLLLAEAAAALTPYLADRARFGDDVLALLDQGRLIPASDYVNAQRLRRIEQEEFRRLWRHVDILFTATVPLGAPRIGQTAVEVEGRVEDVRLAATRLVRGMDVLGLPAVSLPCGLDSEGLPLGLQIVAPEFREAALLRAAAAIERALGIHKTFTNPAVKSE